LNQNEYRIVSDFDGTITIDDSNGLLFLVCGNAENAQIEEDFIAGRLSNREAMLRHFDIMNISLDEYHAFLDTHIRMEPTFDAFLQRVQAEGIPFDIVSGGFRQGIVRVLGLNRLQNVNVYANDLLGTQKLTPAFAMDPVCTKPFGPCGNCKKACLATIRQKNGRKLLYIGDGLTDRCAMEEADLLFAKGALAAYCKDENLSYVPFESFADIAAYLWDD